MIVLWEDGYKISVKIEDDTVVISGNREGLVSLAVQLHRLADGKAGDHIHYDEYNALEEGSAEMIIEKKEF